MDLTFVDLEVQAVERSDAPEVLVQVDSADDGVHAANIRSFHKVLKYRKTLVFLCGSCVGLFRVFGAFAPRRNMDPAPVGCGGT
ncbi:hypothetical protein GCM10023063_24850 [Arthrobacter methylotrophus]